MKLLTILLLISLKLSAQVRVEAENYVDAKGVLVQAVDTGIVGMGAGSSYADYAITVEKSGVYQFDLNVANFDNPSSKIYIKLPTSKSVLATVDVPQGDWRVISVQLPLKSSNKKIRFAFVGSVELDTFSYGVPDNGTVSKKDFNDLKNQVNDYKNKIDSLNIKINNNVFRLDGRIFDVVSDSTKRAVISIPQLRSQLLKK